MSQTTDEQPPPPPGPPAGPPPGPPAGPPAGPPPGPPRSRPGSLDELRRSRTDRKIAGVAGGLARHLDIDPTLVRVLLVVACLFGGAGFLVYVVAWLLLPEDGASYPPLSLSPSTRTALLIGAAAVAVLILLGNALGGFGWPWPLVAVGLVLVVVLLIRDRRRSSATWPQAAFAGPPPRTSASVHPTGWSGATYAPAGPPAFMPSGPPPGPPGSFPGGPPAAPPVRPRRRRGGPLLIGPTVAVLAVGLGVLGLFDTTGAQVVPTAYPALAVAIVGVALLLAAFVARGGGLVLLGVAAVLALSATAVVTTVSGIDDEDERVSFTPSDASAVQDTYYVPGGGIDLDLSALADPRSLAGRSVDVSTVAGTLVVVLPRGVSTTVDASVEGPGELELPDFSSGGIAPSYSATYGSGPDTFQLRVHALAGSIDVRTAP